jgi:hypothetical protein
MNFPPKMVESKKIMVPSEIAPQGLSNEWSCQKVTTILNVLDNSWSRHCALSGKLKKNFPVALHQSPINIVTTVAFNVRCEI